VGAGLTVLCRHDTAAVVAIVNSGGVGHALDVVPVLPLYQVGGVLGVQAHFGGVE